MYSLNEEVRLSILQNKQVRLFIKREDLIHPYISGNKYHKLKYNLLTAKEFGYKTLLTFGGAFSNHILAVAAAGKEHGFNTIGVIRGEELQNKVSDNPTLQKARDFGMQFHFVSRSQYRDKTDAIFLERLRSLFSEFYLIPEGGTNSLAVKGCEEILTDEDNEFNIICSAVGTGGTISGIINSSSPNQNVLGFQALKGDFLTSEIKKYTHKSNWELISDYHFGGYAKVNADLIEFINDFKKDTGIQLDPVYTGKMLYGILDLVKNNYFNSKTNILAIHTGGLQGIEGMNLILKSKKLPLIRG